MKIYSIATPEHRPILEAKQARDEKITRKRVPGLRGAACSLLLLPRRTLQLFERVAARLKTVETDVKQYRSTGKRALCAPPEKKLANFFLSRYFSFRNHFPPRSITIHPRARNQLSGVKRFSWPFHFSQMAYIKIGFIYVLYICIDTFLVKGSTLLRAISYADLDGKKSFY